MITPTYLFPRHFAFLDLDAIISPVFQLVISQLSQTGVYMNHTTLYDQTVLDIIKQESAAFFAGAGSVEETAAKIQSRISIYGPEQSH